MGCFDCSFDKTSLDALLGDTPTENAMILRNILSGVDQGPRSEIVLLNAAAALSLESGDFREGLAAARKSIESGNSLRTLDTWIDLTNSF